MKQFRDNFKTMREKVGLSQSKLATFLDIDQSSISKFEQGSRTMEVSLIEKSCDLFGCTISDLENSNFTNVLDVSFRKAHLTENLYNDIAKINRIALNLIEFDQMENLDD